MSTVTAVPIPPTRRRVIVYLVLGIAAALVAAAALAWQVPVDANAALLARNARQPGVVTTASGLQYKVLAKGEEGRSPTDADIALINYEGKLADGTTFDKSEQPTPLSVAGVVPGFSEALKLMHKGAKYRVWIKPALGYGERGDGPVPPNSVLVFDVELLDFLPENVLRQLQMQQQMQQGGGMPGGPPPGR